MQLAHHLKPFSAALNLFFPPRCAGCDVHVATQGALCAACFNRIGFITPPACAQCGHPFTTETPGHALCGRCMMSAPPYAQARAVLRYEDLSKSLVHKFKYADHTHMAPLYARWMAGVGNFLPQCDLLIPVPLHARRLTSRRYNQSALLARGLSKITGTPALVDGLLRTRPTQPQAGLSQQQREENVRGAFAANPRRLPALKDKTVCLVDDVITTGATLSACTRALQKAGAKQVYVLTLAHTVRE